MPDIFQVPILYQAKHSKPNYCIEGVNCKCEPWIWTHSNNTIITLTDELWGLLHILDILDKNVLL